MSGGWITLTRLGDRDERFVWHVRADQIAHYGRGQLNTGRVISYVGIIGQPQECDVVETVDEIEVAIAKAAMKVDVTTDRVGARLAEMPMRVRWTCPNGDSWDGWIDDTPTRCPRCFGEWTSASFCSKPRRVQR